MNTYALTDAGRVLQTLRASFDPDPATAGKGQAWIPCDDSVQPGDLYDPATGFTPAPPAEPTPRTRLSPLEYRQQFTFDEKAALYTAAESDPIVRMLIDDVAAAEYIELTDPQTVQGLQYLASIGVIAPHRIDVILIGRL